MKEVNSDTIKYTYYCTAIVLGVKPTYEDESNTIMKWRIKF